MTPDIVFFDFDGTLTTKDTMLEFIKFYAGRYNFYKGFALSSPFILAYKLKLMPNYRAKQKVLSHFFKNEPVEKFQAAGRDFATRLLPQLIRPAALAKLQELKAASIPAVIVSASAEDWIVAWSTALGLELIATRLEVAQGRLTGNIAGQNCYGPEKVARIKALYNLDEYAHIHAYGDSSGDKEMLGLAHKSFFKPFR